jgi:hypothetical protein
MVAFTLVVILAAVPKTRQTFFYFIVERGLSPIRSAWPDRHAPEKFDVIRPGEGAASWDNSRSAGGRDARGGGK